MVESRRCWNAESGAGRLPVSESEFGSVCLVSESACVCVALIR
jgi:hypothetical protein